jgi:creatinine amidohydrolase
MDTGSGPPSLPSGPVTASTRLETTLETPVPSILFTDLTREQLRAIAAEGLVILPVAATEQHGPHLPVGTDAFHTEWVTLRAARAVVDRIPLVVAPTLPFGSSPHHLPFGGTLSLGTETFFRVVSELAESLVTDGFRRIFIVNGHGGNHELIELVARDLALRHPVDAAAGSWWAIAWAALVEAGAHLRGRLPGHAGMFETSLVMAMRPELVSPELPGRPDPETSDPRALGGAYRTERSGSWQALDGWTDSPDRARADLGSRYLEIAVDALAARLLEFYETTLTPATGRGRG